MMAYEPQPENEYRETSAEMRFAMAAFAIAAGLEVAAGLFEMSSIAAWDWIILMRGAAVGLVAGGVAYAVALIVAIVAPGLPALLLQKAEDVTGLELDGKPRRDLPTGQPVRERPRPRPVVESLSLVEEPSFEDTGITIEAAPQWKLQVDAMDYGNGRMLINGHLIDLPAGFDLAWLYTVAEKRAAGQLDNVSLRALNDIGVSRWGNGSSPAALTIQVLESTGCVQGRGDNQPCTWTEGGRKTFPSPTN